MQITKVPLLAGHLLRLFFILNSQNLLPIKPSFILIKYFKQPDLNHKINTLIAVEIYLRNFNRISFIQYKILLCINCPFVQTDVLAMMASMVTTDFPITLEIDDKGMR